MFWYKTLQQKINQHHLATVPTRVLLFSTVFFFLSIFNVIADSAHNTSISFQNYHVGPKVAHFFKQMGNAYMSVNHTAVIGRPADLIKEELLFELEPKLNPVFIEHGELEVNCYYGITMDLRCSYIGVIKQPKYYIDEVTFNNSVPDIIPFEFDPFRKYNPPVKYTNKDALSKLATYFFIFENLPSEVYRYPTLQSISQTRDFQIIRERVVAIYQSVISWTYISNYVFWLLTISFAMCHFMMLITKICVTYLGVKNNTHTSEKFFSRLRIFSIIQVMLTFCSYLIHRSIVLLNGVVQSFLFSSVTEGITFNSTKTYSGGISVLGHIIGVAVLSWLLILFHHVVFKEKLIIFVSTAIEPDMRRNEDDGYCPPTSTVDEITRDIRRSMYGSSKEV